ncbi:MAG: hypothetical protein BWY28_01216 [bacterium ADurb.Bin236]|nr:MAG: hypothetical protein BWY28_01216 [bacterium ADurb.Bin236]
MLKKISLKEFDQTEITFDELTYVKMVQLWCVSELPDSVIADKCGVSKSKITKLRRDKYNISLMNMNEHIEKAFDSEMTCREEANAIVAHVFRNGFLEDLHAGIVEEKFLDPKYSRLTNNEMKKLMIECCEKMENLLRLRKENPQAYTDLLKLNYQFYCRDWIK